MSDEIYDGALPIGDARMLPPRQPGVWFCVCGAGWLGEAMGYPDDLRSHADFRVAGGELGAAHDPGSARFRPDAPAPTVDAAALDAAWEALRVGLNSTGLTARHRREVLAHHRPLIEAALRASVRGDET